MYFLIASRNTFCCCLFIALTASLSACGQASPFKMKDAVTPVFKDAEHLVYSYAGNKIDISLKDFEQFYKEKQKGFAQEGEKIKRQMAKREAERKALGFDAGDMEKMRRIPEAAATAGFGNGSKTDFNYRGTVKFDNGSSVRMDIAQNSDGGGLYISFPGSYQANDDRETQTTYVYNDGYCNAFDRRSTTSVTKGFLMNTYVAHEWQREQFVLAGGEIVRAEYFLYDNTGDHDKSEYKSYDEISSGLKQQLLRQAYLYLYIAEQLRNSKLADCFMREVTIRGGNDSLKAFSKRWIQPYIRAHRTMEREDEDNFAFAVKVDSAGMVMIIPTSLRMGCESFRPCPCDSSKLPGIKAGMLALLQQHLPELVFLPSERQCRTYSDQLLLHFSLNDYFGAGFTRDTYKYPGQ